MYAWRVSLCRYLATSSKRSRLPFSQLVFLRKLSSHRGPPAIAAAAKTQPEPHSAAWPTFHPHVTIHQHSSLPLNNTAEIHKNDDGTLLFRIQSNSPLQHSPFTVTMEMDDSQKLWRLLEATKENTKGSRILLRLEDGTVSHRRIEKCELQETNRLVLHVGEPEEPHHTKDGESNTKVMSEITVDPLHGVKLPPRPLKLVNAASPDALEWRPQQVKLSELPGIYMKLSKIRLTGLVVVTQLVGYYMAPAPFSFTVCALAGVGTMLTSCSANSINQFFEVPYDSQMVRTRNRVLVRCLITPFHAFVFGIASGTSGLLILYFGVNGITAALGVANLLLYTLVYTPMKRTSIVNTWVGSVVGAIPPVMGWTACTGGSLSAGAAVLAALLYSWQFPHFNALSWNLRSEYSRAGYRMCSVTEPELCRATALRHSVFLTCLCLGTPLTGLTSWTFAVDSFPVNAYLIYLAYKFYRDADSASSRKLFRYSLIHLPLLLMLMIISKTVKKGQDQETALSTKQLDVR